jgi:membrane protease subunit HflC
MMSSKAWFLLAVSLAVLLKLCMFTVDETQMVVLTSFGKPVATVSVAGLYAKWPWNSRIVFDRRLRVYDPPPSEFLTADKKNLIVDNYVCWRIEDPVRFLSAVGTVPAAEMRIHDIVWATVSAAIGTQPLDTILSTNPKAIKTDEVMQQVTAECARSAQENYGVQIVDVGIKRLTFPEQNKQSVFDRMRAERERIVRQYRAEGESEAMKIRAEADRKKTEILAEAYRQAEMIRGEGEAKASRIYAQAHNADPEFYKFLRTLDTYQKIFSDKTTVVLSSDSELLRLLTRGDAGG